MKRVLLISCFAALCLGQQSNPAGAGTARGWWDVEAAEQTSEGHIYHLRGHAELRSARVTLRADRIDYDEDTSLVDLAGHVTIETDTVALTGEDVRYDDKSGEILGDVKVKLKPYTSR